MTKFNVGDKVRFIGDEWDYADLTNGKKYEITEINIDGEAVILDDVGDERFVSTLDSHFELVDEDAEDAQQTPVPSLSPELADLLANMSRRLYEAENEIVELNEKQAIFYDIDKLLGDRLFELERKVSPSKPTESTAQADEPIASDNVNHPSHYTKGKHETIDIIEHITSGYADPFVAYCVGNTTKYIDRAPYKHGSPSEDLRKAAWYLVKAADYLDGKGA